MRHGFCQQCGTCPECSGQTLLQAVASLYSLDLTGQAPLISNRELELEANSPAIDAANNAEAPALDFNGTQRPQGAAADIGAHEQ